MDPKTKTVKIVSAVILLGVLAVGVGGYSPYAKAQKLLPFYPQLTRERVGTAVSLQPEAQKSAAFVGSWTCKECHEDEYEAWRDSYHSKMIQSVEERPEAVVADFSEFPDDADFSREEIVYTIGGKFKQRYMLRSDTDGSEDYVIGNHQWNTELQRWQPYKPYEDWYIDAFVHDNKQVYTSRTCDGCHFVGFMSRQKRIEPAIACESCHGPGGAHAEEPANGNIYKATNSDPYRSTEICIQCHMRNRDKRLERVDLKDIFGDVRDYPKGYEPGKPLIDYKLQAPFEAGQETKEFYANGVGKKNRMQGDEYIHSAMYKHGITCVNCHDPHKLDATTTFPTGDALCMKCHEYGSVIGPHQKSVEAHTHHDPDSDGASCIECHMPKTGKHLRSSPVTVRTHVLGFITPDETRKYGVPNACTNCHDDKDLEWAEDSLKQWGMAQWK
jgi:formylmethanofuran dehydrogenase subunit E